ncbi:MAG: hypothetical protein KatS3mg128_0061 [Silanimonas sp.]|nr:MAG: hypothetical protein KatS3mg128_0061 [Silanimonas sp.]
MLTPALVPFRGQTLLTVRDGEQVRVAIRPICEALGLNWSAQYRRLLRTPVLAKRVTKMAMPSAGGSQDTLTLPLDLLNGWLFGIDVQRVRPERREALIAYQEECYAVLARHRGIAPRRALPAGHQLAAHRLRARLLAQMGRSRSRAEQQALHEQLVQLSSELGLDCPPLADFAEPAPNARLLADFWAAVLALLGSGERLNHARNPAPAGAEPGRGVPGGGGGWTAPPGPAHAGPGPPAEHRAAVPGLQGGELAAEPQDREVLGVRARE